MRSYEEIFGSTMAHVAVDAKMREYAVDAEISLAHRANAVLKENLENVDLAIRKVESGASNVPDEDLAGTLAWLIAERAYIGRQLRKNYAAMYAYYGYDKSEFRNMIVGYYVNDNGFATDEDGKPIGETVPGEFIIGGQQERLHPCNEESVTIRNKQGDVVCTIARDNIPAIEEALANFDMPVRDQINLLYSVLSSSENHPLHACRSTIIRTNAYLARHKNTRPAGPTHESPESKAHSTEEQ